MASLSAELCLFSKLTVRLTTDINNTILRCPIPPACGLLKSFSGFQLGKSGNTPLGFGDKHHLIISKSPRRLSTSIVQRSREWFRMTLRTLLSIFYSDVDELLIIEHLRQRMLTACGALWCITVREVNSQQLGTTAYNSSKAY